MDKIETARLILRSFSENDASDVFEYAKNPNVGPAAGWKPHENIEESLDVIRNVFIKNETWAICLKQNGKCIGSIELKADSKRKGINSCELGYVLSEDFWGQGIMTEAAKAVIKYGFTKLALDIIAVTHNPENIRSKRVIEKCGFTYEGTLRKSFKAFDGLQDECCYSMFKEEYTKNAVE